MQPPARPSRHHAGKEQNVIAQVSSSSEHLICVLCLPRVRLARVVVVCARVCHHQHYYERR
jgi:hypothetical protein